MFILTGWSLKLTLFLCIINGSQKSVMTQSRPNLQYVYYHYLIMYCYICDWLHFLIIIKILKICHLSFFDKACNCLYQFVGKTFFLRIFPKKVWIINVPKLFRGNVIAKQSESKRSCPRFDYADISTTVKGGWPIPAGW